MLLFLDFLYFSLLPPEGLKKVRNPDRMYRSAVCYAGHGPPKSISDDTETNSKSQLLILHCCKRPLAGLSIIHSLIHLFTSWFHPPTHPPLPCYSFSHSSPFLLLQHNTSSGLLCWLKCLLYGITLSIAEVLSLTKSDCFRLRPGDQDLRRPSERKLTLWAINYSLVLAFSQFLENLLWKNTHQVNSELNHTTYSLSMEENNACLFLRLITVPHYEAQEQRQHNIIAEVFMTCKTQLLWELLQCIYKSVRRCYFLPQPKQIIQKYRPKPWFVFLLLIK